MKQVFVLITAISLGACGGSNSTQQETQEMARVLFEQDFDNTPFDFELSDITMEEVFG